MGDTAQTYEAKPGKDIAERLSSAASIHGIGEIDTGGKGKPELTALDWVGALSGSGDPIGEAAVAVRYMDQHNMRPKLEQAMHLWGLERFMRLYPKVNINGRLHKRMATGAVMEYTAGKLMTRDQRIEHLMIGPARWDKLRNHYADLIGRLQGGESVAIRHVAHRIKTVR